MLSNQKVLVRTRRNTRFNKRSKLTYFRQFNLILPLGRLTERQEKKKERKKGKRSSKDRYVRKRKEKKRKEKKKKRATILL